MVLSRKAKKLLKRTKARIEKWLVGKSNRKWASKILYGCIKNSFAREERAVLAGRHLFNQKAQSPDESSSLLRRNIHRIEKGIISRPRRAIFAEDYIKETIDIYIGCLSSDVSVIELAWATDVLDNYFSIVDETAIILPAKNAFLNTKLRIVPQGTRNERRHPYIRPLAADIPSYDQLLELMQKRRSVRWFENRTVPRKLILKAMTIATLSPSACNRQPFRFHIFDDPELLAQVAKLPPGTHGFEHNFPCVIAVIGRQRYYFDERDRHLIYVDASLAVMSFILALETLGLSSCCINWPDIEENEKRAEKALKLAPDERPIMFIALGYPDQEQLVPYSEKRTPEELCRFNFE